MEALRELKESAANKASVLLDRYNFDVNLTAILHSRVKRTLAL